MPHIVIEHSESVAKTADLEQLAKALHKELSLQETVNLEAIKTRTIRAENVILGSCPNDSFIHVTLKLLPGRDLSLKEKMAKSLFHRTLTLVESSADCRVSLEVADLGVYIKNS